MPSAVSCAGPSTETASTPPFARHACCNVGGGGRAQSKHFRVCGISEVAGSAACVRGVSRIALALEAVGVELALVRPARGLGLCDSPAIPGPVPPQLPCTRIFQTVLVTWHVTSAPLEALPSASDAKALWSLPMQKVELYPLHRSRKECHLRRPALVRVCLLSRHEIDGCAMWPVFW